MEDIILWCYSAFMLTCIVLGTYWDYKNHHGMYWDGVKWVKRDEK